MGASGLWGFEFQGLRDLGHRDYASFPGKKKHKTCFQTYPAALVNNILQFCTEQAPA